MDRACARWRFAARPLDAIRIDHVQIERYEFEESGEYNLEGLFLRLGDAIDTIKAKRVVLDTIEVLFTRIQNQAIVRAALLQLLFRFHR